MRTRAVRLSAILLGAVLLTASLNAPFAAQEPRAQGKQSPSKAVAAPSTPLGTGKKPLRLEEIYTDAGLTGRMPSQMRWSPDGKRLTYILQEDQGERRDLWVVEAATGEKRVLVSYDQLTKLAPPYEGVVDEREKERLLRYSVAAYRSEE